MNYKKLLSRRAVLHHTALLTGGALSASLMAGVLAGCKPSSRAGTGELRALSSEQYELVAEIAETIIPQTETPGARAANVQSFIDHILADWYTGEERAAFLAGLRGFAERCLSELGTTFTQLSIDRRAAFLEGLDHEALEARSRLGRAALRNRAQITALPFFAMMKELAIVGYYTSEAGMAAIGYQGPIGASAGGQGPSCSSVWN